MPDADQHQCGGWQAWPVLRSPVLAAGSAENVSARSVVRNGNVASGRGLDSAAILGLRSPLFTATR